MQKLLTVSPAAARFPSMHARMCKHSKKWPHPQLNQCWPMLKTSFLPCSSDTDAEGGGAAGHEANETAQANCHNCLGLAFGPRPGSVGANQRREAETDAETEKGAIN